MTKEQAQKQALSIMTRAGAIRREYAESLGANGPDSHKTRALVLSYQAKSAAFVQAIRMIRVAERGAV